MTNLQLTLKQLNVLGYKTMSREEGLKQLSKLVVKQEGNIVTLKNKGRCIVDDILNLQ